MKLFRYGRQRYNFRPHAEGNFNVGLTTVENNGVANGVGLRIRVENSDHIFALCLNETETLRLGRYIQDHTTGGRIVFKD